MKNSTALGAKEKTTHTITFKSKQHENFYQEYLSKDRYQDVYYKALVYCLGISEDTRNCWFILKTDPVLTRKIDPPTAVAMSK